MSDTSATISSDSRKGHTTRCFPCGGRFGPVRHRLAFKQFCSTRYLSAHEAFIEHTKTRIRNGPISSHEKFDDDSFVRFIGRAVHAAALWWRMSPVPRLVLTERAYRMLAVPARHRARLNEDAPLFRPPGRAVALRHRRYQLAPRAHADSRHRRHRSDSVTPPQSLARTCSVTFLVRQCAPDRRSKIARRMAAEINT